MKGSLDRVHRGGPWTWGPCFVYVRGVSNLVPRSPTVIRKGDLVKFDLEHAQRPARPEIRAFLSLRMFVLSVVILGDFAE